MSKEEIKIEIPIMTNFEVKQFERLMETEFERESLIDEVKKHIYRDKECIYLQKMVEKLKNDLDKEKEKNKQMQEAIKYDFENYTKNYIKKDKIREKIKDYDSKGYIEIAGALQELLEEK